MIFFCAVNDINERSKFNRSVVESNKPVWGITELSTSAFNKIKQGDFVFFYNKGFIVGLAKVKKTEVNADLSEKEFGYFIHRLKGKLLWSNLIYLDSFSSIKLPFEEIIKIGNYSEKFSIRRLINLNEIGINRILKDYDSIHNYVKFITTKYSN